MSIFDDDEGQVAAVVVAAADAGVVSDAEADVDDWRRVREINEGAGLVDNELYAENKRDSPSLKSNSSWYLYCTVIKIKFSVYSGIL